MGFSGNDCQYFYWVTCQCQVGSKKIKPSVKKKLTLNA